MIDISLNENEINVILKVLGDQPTSSGLWPLCMNIKNQAEEFIQSASKAEDVDEQL